jgi:hypothetical protein
MFAFTDSPRWVTVRVPKQVRKDADTYAKLHAQDYQANYVGRQNDYATILLDCVCGWAFSKWCNDEHLWHDPNYLDDNDIDCVLDLKDVGLTPVVIVPKYLLDQGGIDTPGLRVSHWRLSVEKPNYYIAASFSGHSVTFYGGAVKYDILGSSHIFEARPLIYDVPEDDLNLSMGWFAKYAVKTNEPQETFYNIFDEEAP